MITHNIGYYKKNFNYFYITHKKEKQELKESNILLRLVEGAIAHPATSMHVPMVVSNILFNPCNTLYIAYTFIYTFIYCTCIYCIV